MNAFNPLDHPICLAPPLRRAVSAWHEHVPFGMFLIDALRPRVVVELGTHHGVSYCAFCQAIKALGLDTRCYAIDTWRGDPQTGLYEPSTVLPELKAHHDPLYGGFSTLIQATFDEAASTFPDESIDLLHIDGCHAYEAVKYDFETWLPKIAPRGVVLFHDTNVREGAFGVWRLWEELKLHHPHFELLNGHGLGLLALGEPQPDPIQQLLQLAPGALSTVREFFFQMGRRGEERANGRVVAGANVTEGSEREIEELRRSLQVQADELAQLGAAFQEREYQMRDLQAVAAEREVKLTQAARRLESDLAREKTKVEELEGRLAEATRHEVDWEQERARLAQAAQQESERQHEAVTLAQAAQQREAELTRQLYRTRYKLSALLARRSFIWLQAASDRFSRYSAWAEVDPAFQQLKDDSLLFGGRIKAFRLRPSPDLGRVPFVAYPLSPGRVGLCGVLLAPVLDAPLAMGRIGVELVSPDGKRVLAQTVASAAQLTEEAPVRFDFPPIVDTAKGRFWLRVFARDLDGPLRVFELNNYGPSGFGPRRARAFCGLIFED